MSDTIAVIGAGQMGNGIAHVAAQSGISVTMIDVSADALARGCYQVLSMLGPYLRGDTRLLFEKLAEEYLKKLPEEGRDPGA